MPWNESNRMDERIKFVARLLDGENMSAVCREFGISRKSPASQLSLFKFKIRHEQGVSPVAGSPYTGA